MQQKYTELTPVEASRLLADKGTPIENCVFSNYDDVGYRGHIRSSLQGIQLGRTDFPFMSAERGWKKCWKVEKETVFEVGDRVRACNQVTGVHGLCGTVTAIYPGGYPVHFGAHTISLRGDELELAPEPDPFEEWADEYHEHFGLTDAGRFLSKSAFKAGRDYERGKLHE